jgi:L-iditol 2-dehydrogenase
VRGLLVSSPANAEIVELGDPPAKVGESIVEVEWASMCSTDRKLFARGPVEPRVIGHEGVGYRADGTLVGIHPDIGCGRCDHCLAGFENRCARRQSIGIDRDGCLADRVAVPTAHALPINDIEPQIAPLLEPLACALHAVSLLEANNERAVVVGAGAMGILGMWALKARGCTVAVCQRSDERRTLAQELGADVVLAPEESPSEGLGAPPGVAFVAAPGREPVQWACDRVAAGGRVHVFAGTPGEALVDANVIHYKHLTLVGSTGSTRMDYERALQLAATGEIKLDGLPRAHVRLEEVPQLLASRQDPQILKVIVDVMGRRE